MVETLRMGFLGFLDAFEYPVHRAGLFRQLLEYYKTGLARADSGVLLVVINFRHASN